MTPRLGFVGLGWIGRNRLQSVVEAGAASPVAYLDPDPGNLQAAQAVAPARAVDDLDALLDLDLDGVVIATPNALHAPQSLAALEHDLPVFCQKPLSPTHREAQRVVQTAMDADRLLDVDWSYRGTDALSRLRDELAAGTIGTCYRAEAWFHNAYGPDKAWYHDRTAAGGGCLMDLGCHLLDTLQWVGATPGLEVRHAALYRKGRPASGENEDHATVQLEAGDGRFSASVACSWNVPSGGDCDIRCTFYGDQGVLRFSNVGGSFYDFTSEHLTRGNVRTLAAPPDAWSGRQTVLWTRRLVAGQDGFDPTAWQTVENARLLEDAYRCAS